MARRKATIQSIDLSDGSVIDTPEPVEEKRVIITSARLKDIFCHFAWDETVAPGIVNGLNNKCGLPIHEDLKEAFWQLNAHLAVICEEIPEGTLPNDITKIAKYIPESHLKGSIHHLVSLFSVDSFTITGKKSAEVDGRSVSLTGTKELSTGSHVSLTTPRVKFDGGYQYLHDLIMAVENAIEEVEKYKGGKTAPVVIQGSLDLGDEEDYGEVAR